MITLPKSMPRKSFQVGGYDVKLTCECFPEQYNVFRKGKITGYIRVRHGMCWAYCPDAGGERVYEANCGHGSFSSDQERSEHMVRIMNDIDVWYQKHNPKIARTRRG